MWDTFEFQTFCEFCSRCFTSGIVWTPPPVAECIAGHIHTECSLSSKDVPVLCMWGFAHVCSLRNVVLFFTRHLWLFSLRYFPRVLFILLWKSYTSCFLDRGTTVWYIVMAVLFFFSEETLPFWSGKPGPSASCKNISTCLKNFRETTWPLGSSWRPLVWREGGPTPLFHDFCKEHTQGPPLTQYHLH